MSPPSSECVLPADCISGCCRSAVGRAAIRRRGRDGRCAGADDLLVGRAERLSAAGPLAERALQFARQFAAHGSRPSAAAASEPACHIEIESAPPEHVGLGTGTQLGLAVAAGLAGLKPPRPHNTSSPSATAMRCAGRAGLGAASARRSARMGSPAADCWSKGASQRPARFRRWSADWSCPTRGDLCCSIDREQRGLSGAHERRAFADLPPAAADVTAALCREVLVDMLPAAAEGDFDAFGESLYRYGHEAGYLVCPAAGGGLCGRAADGIGSLAPHAGSARRGAKLVGADDFCPGTRCRRRPPHWPPTSAGVLPPPNLPPSLPHRQIGAR